MLEILRCTGMCAFCAPNVGFRGLSLGRKAWKTNRPDGQWKHWQVHGKKWMPTTLICNSTRICGENLEKMLSKNVYAVWVTSMLTAEMKKTQATISRALVARYNQNFAEILLRLVTSDKTCTSIIIHLKANRNQGGEAPGISNIEVRGMNAPRSSWPHSSGTRRA